jgi:GR25 family glycosyltransferase involved in LPS biosynthesis
MNYVISLERTPERLEVFLKNNEHLKFNIFKAIDGSSMAQLGCYGKGAVGNAMSHIELWRRCAQGNEYFIICEDDAELHKDFEAVVDKIPQDFDFICFGWNFDADLWVSLYPPLSPVRMSFNQDSMRNNKNHYLNNPLDCSLLRLHLFNGTFCYAISPAGASKFLEICYPLKQAISVAIPDYGEIKITPTALDSAMPEAFQSTNSFVCFPPLALAENNHSESTVQNA